MEKLFGKVFPGHFCRKLAVTWHKAQTVPGVGWHSMGLGAQGAQDGGRLSARTWVLPANTQAAFQDWPRLAVEVAEVAALESPEENWEMERNWGGSRDFQGGELEDGQEVSLAIVCNSRALWEFENSVRAMSFTVPVSLWGSRSTVGPFSNHVQLWMWLTTTGQLPLSWIPSYHWNSDLSCILHGP